jgi:hypothetical protein
MSNINDPSDKTPQHDVNQREQLRRDLHRTALEAAQAANAWLCSLEPILEMDNLLTYIDGISDERDSVPLLLAVRPVAEGEGRARGAQGRAGPFDPGGPCPPGPFFGRVGPRDCPTGCAAAGLNKNLLVCLFLRVERPLRIYKNPLFVCSYG